MEWGGAGGGEACLAWDWEGGNWQATARLGERRRHLGGPEVPRSRRAAAVPGSGTVGRRRCPGSGTAAVPGSEALRRAPLFFFLDRSCQPTSIDRRDFPKKIK